MSSSKKKSFSWLIYFIALVIILSFLEPDIIRFFLEEVLKLERKVIINQ